MWRFVWTAAEPLAREIFSPAPSPPGQPAPSRTPAPPFICSSSLCWPGSQTALWQPILAAAHPRSQPLLHWKGLLFIARQS